MASGPVRPGPCNDHPSDGGDGAVFPPNYLHMRPEFVTTDSEEGGREQGAGRPPPLTRFNTSPRCHAYLSTYVFIYFNNTRNLVYPPFWHQICLARQRAEPVLGFSTTTRRLRWDPAEESRRKLSQSWGRGLYICDTQVKKNVDAVDSSPRCRSSAFLLRPACLRVRLVSAVRANEYICALLSELMLAREWDG